MEKEYHLAKSRLVFIGLFVAFAVATAGRGFYLYTLYKQPEWLVLGIVPLIIACIVFPLLTTVKVIISPAVITRFSLFGSSSLLLADIAGYRMRRIPKSRRMLLVLVSKSGRNLNIRYFQLEDGEEILMWAEQRFVRLD